MKKADIESRMADYLEGDLPLEDRALFDAHLDANPEAAREVDELRRTIDMLRSLPDPEPPAGLVGNVMREIRLQETNRSWWQRLSTALSPGGAPQWAVPMLAAAALVVLAILSGDLTAPTGGGDPASSTPQTLALAESAAPGGAREGRDRDARSPSAPSAADITPRTGRVAEAPRAGAPGEPPAVARPERALDPPSQVARTPNQAPLVPVGNPPTQVSRLESSPLVTGPGTGAFQRPAQNNLGSTAVGSEPGSEVQRNARLDEMLAALREDPDSVASFLAQDSATSREVWGTHLARRAHERGLVEETRAAIEANPRLAGGPLSAAFQTEVDRLDREVVAREVEAAPTAESEPGR